MTTIVGINLQTVALQQSPLFMHKAVMEIASHLIVLVNNVNVWLLISPL